jgi:hypothetical protein
MTGRAAGELDAIAVRGLEPHERETYANGVCQTI